MPYPVALFLVMILGFPVAALADVESEPVRRETLSETIRLDGVIEAVQESTVSAQTSGTVQRLPYDVDDSVEAGELIVKLEDSEQQARLDQARGNLQEAEANHRNALQQFRRIEEVHEQGYVSRQEFDQAQNNLAAARARLERARAAVEEAQEQLDYTTVIAPYTGILTARHVEVGESVSPGQPLLSGLSLEQLRIVVELPQMYVDKVRAERRTRVTLGDGRVLRTGEMTFYPYADARTHTFRLRLALEEPEATLYPGMLVKVEAPVAEREALWIPASSLIQRSELRAVYVLDREGSPRLRQIRTGVRRDGQIEVLAGLDEGEQVVTNPGDLAGEGGGGSARDHHADPREADE
ncbi:RND family efflux transporter, MFP subunit [Marinobacter daqiaonensis]|uniref:RND family efflux transporter, MFP subunit n=1 Tax=Marinobacter daqiaonensis TaxID=650891 RepID=A0A1I6I4M7_9GAMM|nr:efflux RND transporter periplasmic adaptor subunit [Marinobacter daqiaonensis]SFR61588.1 RND family efflux transporter, MFP subunit [Marinobacter daqiaonensis]